MTGTQKLSGLHRSYFLFVWFVAGVQDAVEVVAQIMSPVGTHDTGVVCNL